MGDETQTPNTETITLWLKNGLTRAYVHEQGWREVSRRQHAMVRAIRPYILEHFDPEEQKAAFDGFTLALMTIAHFEDIAQLAEHLATVTPASLHDEDQAKKSSSMKRSSSQSS